MASSSLLVRLAQRRSKTAVGSILRHGMGQEELTQHMLTQGMLTHDMLPLSVVTSESSSCSGSALPPKDSSFERLLPSGATPESSLDAGVTWEKSPYSNPSVERSMCLGGSSDSSGLGCCEVQGFPAIAAPLETKSSAWGQAHSLKRPPQSGLASLIPTQTGYSSPHISHCRRQLSTLRSLPSACLAGTPQLTSLTPFQSSSGGILPLQLRSLATRPDTSQSSHKDGAEKGLASQEDIFDTITDKIPERPVTAAEGASYSVVILVALAVAGGALYFVAKELLFEPKEYTVFNQALLRVQRDAQVVSYLGSPITGYGQESRNRAARQRISNKVWKDEDGVERIMIQFHIRGTGGAGVVQCEMFKDPEERNKLKYTYLVVDITSPVRRRLMLESYIPK